MARNNTSDPGIQKRLRDAEERREKELSEAKAWVMSDPKGRLVMYNLLFDKLGIMDVYHGQDSAIYRHEGKREVALDIIKELQEKMPERYLTMISERQADQGLLIAAAPTGEDDA